MAEPISSVVGIKTNQRMNTGNMSIKAVTATSNGSGDTPVDEGIGSMDSSDGNQEGGMNFQQTLLDLKVLNGQPKFVNKDHIPATKLGDAENSVQKYVNNIEYAKPENSNLNLKSCKNNDDDDLVILDDCKKPESDSISGLGLFSNRNNTSPGPINVFDENKPSPFAINEKMRSSFRDIMNKIQENTPSLQKLLAKTKYTGLDTKDSKSSLNHSMIGQNNGSSSKGDNLFDNLKEIQTEPSKFGKNDNVTTDTKCDTEKKSVLNNGKPEPDVMEIDDPEKTDDKKDEMVPVDNSASAPTEKLALEESSKSNCDSKHIDLVQSVTNKKEENKCDKTNSEVEDEILVLELDSDVDSDKECFDKEKSKAGSEDQEMKEEEEEKLLSLDTESSKSNSPKEEDVKVKEEDKKDESLTIDDTVKEPIKKETEETVVEKKDVKQEETGDCKEEKMEVDDEDYDKKDEIKAVMKCEIESVSKSESIVSEDSNSNITDSQVKSDTENDTLKNEDDDEEDDEDDEEEEEEADVGEDDDDDEEEETKTDKDNDRKRPAVENDEKLESATKRSRLDLVIGKLGSQIGISPDSADINDVVSDSETTTESATEETEDEEDFKKRKKKKSIRLSEKALENVVKSKILKYLSSQKESMISDLQKKVEELQGTNEMWKNKVKDLEKKVLEVTVLQQKHEKRKAKTAALRQISTKSIGVQVDINRAHAALLQQSASTSATTRSPVHNAQAKTPPHSISTSPMTKINSASKSPVSSVPPALTAPTQVTLNPPATQLVTNIQTQYVPIVARTQGQGTTIQPVILTTTNNTATTPSNGAVSKIMFPNNQTVKSILDSTRSANSNSSVNQTVKSILDTNKNTLPQVTAPQILTKAQVMSSPQVFTQSPSLPVNMGNRSMIPTGYIVVTSHQPISSINSASKPITGVSQTVTVTQQQPPKNKIIDLTQEEESNKNSLMNMIPLQVKPITSGQPVLRQMAPSGPGIPSQGIMISASPTTNPMVRTPQQPAYQLVFNSTSPALKPGSLITLPVPSTAVRSTVPVSGVQPLGVPALAHPLPPPQLRPVPNVVTTALQGKLRPVSSITTTSVQPPQLRPMQNPSTVATSIQPAVLRQPPPLQTGPQNSNLKASATPATIPVTVVDSPNKHPAPLPLSGRKCALPKPTLKISRVSQGIVLSWNIASSQTSHPDIASYQLYAYQETSTPPSASLWKKVGDVKALPLPMACTLTQFQEGNKYHFAVRPIDLKGQAGPFSEPSTIHLTPTKKD